MMEDVSEDARNRFECTYVFRRKDDVTEHLHAGCVNTLCVGNTDQAIDPDIVCSDGTQLLLLADLTEGRTEAECCERRGYCVANDPDSADAVDIACAAPSELIPNAAVVPGRSSGECCINTGLCIGNTDLVAEPDTVCSEPGYLLPHAATTVGRSSTPGDACCGVTGMCVGNTDQDAEPDVPCPGPWELLDGAADVRRGHSDEEGWRCCHTPCAFEPKEAGPVCHCGSLGPDELDASLAQVLLLAASAIVLTMMRVRAPPAPLSLTSSPGAVALMRCAYACACFCCMQICGWMGMKNMHAVGADGAAPAVGAAAGDDDYVQIDRSDPPGA